MRGREYERIVWMATTRTWMVVDFDVDVDGEDDDDDDETEGGYNGGDRVVVVIVDRHHHHCQNRFQTESS